MEIISITLRSNVSIRFTKDKSKAVDLDADIEISCSANMNGCDGSTVTYSWKAPLENCNMVLLKKIRGYWLNERFVSEKDGIILDGKLQVKPNGCHFMAQPTNLKNIFIVDSENFPLIANNLLPFQADDLNIPDFVMERDEFVKWQVEANARQHRKNQRSQVCRRLTTSKEQNLVRNQENGVILPTDQPGLFHRAKGEVIEEFHCSITIVQPREIDHCTEDFPVTYLGKEYFIAPTTRILSKTSSVQPCSRLGAPEFITKSGQWVIAVPKVAYTSLPRTRNELEVGQEEDKIQNDANHLGIYTQEDLKQYSHQLLFPRQQKELTSTLAAQRCMNGGRSCGFYNGKESTQPIIHDSELFDPISFFKGLPGKLGAEIWSAMIQYIDDFVRVIVIVFVLFVSYLVTKFKKKTLK